MSENTATAADTKVAKPPVFDARPESDKPRTAIELGLRVRLEGDKDTADNGGTKPEGVVTGIEYNRKRVVIKLDSQEKLVVRPASVVWVLKNKSGNVIRVERAVRAGKKAAEEIAAV